jgi:hypothetical protein
VRIRFLDTYNFTPVEDRRMTTKYRKNMEITCRRIDGMIAVANGAAVEIAVPARGEAPEVKPVKARAPRAARTAAARSAEIKGNA